MRGPRFQTAERYLGCSTGSVVAVGSRVERFRPGDAVFCDLSALPNRRCCRSRRAWLSNRWPRYLRRTHDRESRRESDLDNGLAVIWFIALADGSRRLLPGNSLASTGNSNCFERQLATKKSAPPRHRVRRLREPSFPAPFDRISDPQIPLTRPQGKPREAVNLAG